MNVKSIFMQLNSFNNFMNILHRIRQAAQMNLLTFRQTNSKTMCFLSFKKKN